MSQKHTLLSILGAIIFAGWASYHFYTPKAYAGLECADSRVVAYGWTNESRSLAELAAILKWKESAEIHGAGGYTKWIHARDRYISCHLIGGKEGQFQCKTAATPCRPASS